MTGRGTSTVLGGVPRPHNGLGSARPSCLGRDPNGCNPSHHAWGGEVGAWQTRPLEPLYPIIYLDALSVKVRDGHHVANRAAHIAVGWIPTGSSMCWGSGCRTGEGPKFWAGVCAELAKRGVKDVLIVCCDGLIGFPEAIEATWPLTTVQTCTVHHADLRVMPVIWLSGEGCGPSRSA